MREIYAYAVVRDGYGVQCVSRIRYEGTDISTLEIFEPGDQGQNGIPAMNRALAIKAGYVQGDGQTAIHLVATTCASCGSTQAFYA